MKNISQYMQEVMCNKDTGYYVVGDPIGAKGDFITAPEISQLFGEMIGIYCVNQWIKIGSPAKFALVELGPGRGTLMADLLRATKHVQGFHKAIDLHLVELNLNHIKLQKQAINFVATWHESIYTLPTDLPLIVIANEFFDCLPIHQYVSEFGNWYQVCVKDGEIKHAKMHPSLNQQLKENHPDAKNGYIIEFTLAAQAIVYYFAMFAAHLLIIDYGYEETPFISTLQAVKNHQYCSIFEKNADLTAYVDFASLKCMALAQGCEVGNVVTQREFLTNLGIRLRAEMLKKNASIEEQRKIDMGVDRLIDPNRMGDLFKVMSIDKKI